jgi:gas vesicle protein
MARDEGGNGFLWFLAGLGIGAIVGVLYAPKSGAETRETILRSAEEGREWAASTARRAREQAGEWVERGKEAVNTQRDTWNQAIQAGKQAYREATTGTETTRSTGGTGQPG